MHFSKEYIKKYNETKEDVKRILLSMEINLDILINVKKIENVEECSTFLDEKFAPCFTVIEKCVKEVVVELSQLQQFCHDDIRNVIPSVTALEDMCQDEAFAKAKDINWLIETIQNDSKLSPTDRVRLLDISEFNKKVRYFIHSTLAIVENPLPFVVKSKLKKNIKNNEMKYTPSEMHKDISYCTSEVYRIKKAIDQFHILSNSDYGNWASEESTCSELCKYLEIYKHRFEGYFYNEKLFKINVELENKLADRVLNVPLDKVKEVIDVLMHNAAEELVEKELSTQEFDKQITCVIDELDGMCNIVVSDNGRGIGDNNISMAFLSTKTNSKNYGIGLDIAKKNSIILNGSLVMGNNEHEGAEFKLNFPFEITVNKEGFGHKLNVLLIGKNSTLLNKKLEELQEKHSSFRVLKAEDESAVKELISSKILNAMEIVIKEKNEPCLDKWLKSNNFSGELVNI